MKRKTLLLAILLIVGAWGQLYAQKDVTSQYITNATLSNGLTGWTNNNFNTPQRGNNTVGYASECYAGWGSLEKTAYSLKQTITLPEGNYTLVNYSFFRYGLEYNTDPATSQCVLYAGDNSVPIKTLGSITCASYANSQSEGADVFDSKMYRNTVDFQIPAGGASIEIGLDGTFNLKQSWIIAGMFELINNDELATMDSPFDVTGYITNPGFEYRDMTGWTVSPEGYFGTQNNNQSFKVGRWYAEKWQSQASGALAEGSMTQTLTDLPAGLYQLTANLGGNGTYIDLNGKTANWTADGNYTVSYVLAEGDPLVITAGKTAEGTANWIHFDNFKLNFCGDVAAALTTLCAEVTKYQDILPAEAYSALVDAVDAKNQTYTDPDELLTAISDITTLYADADELATAYADYNTALEAAQTVLATQGIDEMVNATVLGELQTAAGATVSPQTVDAYNAATAAINQAIAPVKSIVDALTTGTVATNDLSGWAISTTNGVLACNTWSIEGETDGSGMLIPFVQDWVASGTALNGGNEGGMLYYTFNGLIPGNRYTISALVRVFNEAGTGVTGATFFAGDDIKNLDDFASACSGDFANKGKYATFTATGEVDANGVLQFGVLLAADSPINWIAIKNVTIEEASGILPTSITLDPTALTLKTGETGTIAATVAPEEAEDKTIVWTSTDENVATVANGIVTAWGAGSATITATALADETVVATATVTVTDAPDIAHKSTLSGDGGYLIRNVATGKYLGAANSWGTQGSLVEHGVIAQLIGSSAGYTITDIVTSTSGLGDNCYADNGSPAAFDITPVAGKENVYNIVLGSGVLSAQPGTTILAFLENPGSTLAQWEFIDEADRLANLQEASESNPQDATYYIMDPNFSRNNGYYDNWTFEANKQKNHGGLQTNLCVESYHSTFNMEQTLIVPNGTYRVSAQGFYRDDNSTDSGRPYFFANEATATFPERTGSEESMDAASTSFLAGNYTIAPFTVEVKDRVLKIGARNDSNELLWCIWDNFSIEMISYSENQGIDVKIGNVGYSTLYYGDVDLVIPSGVTAYTVTTEDDAITLNEIDGTIPAGTGVVLEAAAGTYTFDIAQGAEAIENNELKGTDEATTISETGYLYYVLSTKAGSNGDAKTIGFYWANEDGTSVDNGAHKAYLAIPQTSDAPSSFLFDFTNGINNAEVAAQNEGVAYTLSGIRVNGKLAKGVYIVNGKKVIVK